jgi:ABC-type transport system involved in multi-copper enzyme maturation permease subunit
MTDWGLTVAVAAAVLFAAACTVLPGAAAVVGSLVRPGQRSGVLGPLFWYELTRLARRGQQPKLRALYAGILLVGLLVTYLNEFREVNPITLIFGRAEQLFPLDRMASFSERFLTTFLFCQLVGVVIITPVYAGGAVPEERDRGTLDDLRASLLTNREIVAALFTARLVFVGGLVVTGLPILGLTLLFGGIDPNALIGGFVIALMTVLSLGGFSLYMGVQGRGLREVLIWAYSVAGLVAVVGGCCWCFPGLGSSSPFTMTLLLLEPPSTLRWGSDLDVYLNLFVLVHGVAAVALTWLATARVRVPPPAWRKAVTRIKRKELPQDDEPEFEPSGRRRRERPAPRSFRAPRVGAEDPLLWKERYFSGRMPGFDRGFLAGCAASVVAIIVFVVGLWLFVAFVELVVKREDPSDILNPLARYSAFAAAVALAPAVGFRAATAVGRERQRRTLDALFSLPVDRRDVLRAKWFAPLLWAQYWFVGVAVVVGIAAATGSVHPLGLFVAAVLLAAFVPFCDTLGLWLSVRCQSATRAVTWFAVVLLALFLAPLLLSTLTRAAFQLAGYAELGGYSDHAVEALSVPHTAHGALFRWGDWESHFRNTAAVLSGLTAAAGYAVTARVLWWDAARVFEKEGRS